jgi:hypothetical protein
MTATTTADQATGTAISSAGVALLGTVAVAVAGCGSKSVVQSKPIVAGAPFASVRPAPAPANWQAATIPIGAVLAYPPGWTRVASDPGTATAIRADGRQRIAGYLNATPRQGSETLANWPQFRARHNAAEGDRAVTTEAAAYGVRFPTGSGSCVRDSYTTVSRARYVEIACLVAGTDAMSVIVAAATRADWTQLAPLLYRALSAFRT